MKVTKTREGALAHPHHRGNSSKIVFPRQSVFPNPPSLNAGS